MLERTPELGKTPINPSLLLNKFMKVFCTMSGILSSHCACLTEANLWSLNDTIKSLPCRNLEALGRSTLMIIAPSLLGVDCCVTPSL